MPDFDWSKIGSLAAQILPAVAGAMVGGGRGGIGAIPGALYGAASGARYGIESDMEQRKMDADIAYRQQLTAHAQQQMDLEKQKFSASQDQQQMIRDLMQGNGVGSGNSEMSERSVSIGPNGPTINFRAPSAAEKASAVRQQKENEAYTLATQKFVDGSFPDLPSAMLSVFKEKPDLVQYMPSEVRAQFMKTDKQPTMTNEDKQRDILAKGKGYTSFAAIPDPKIQDAIESDRVKRYKTDPGVTIVNARSDAYENSRERYTKWERTNAPVTPDKMNNYVTLTGQSPTNDPRIKDPSDASPVNLGKAGYRYLPESRLKPFQSGLQALTQIERIEAAGKKLFQGVGKGQNMLNAANLKAQQFLGDPDVREFNTLVLETMPTLALQSGLSAGRVGDQIIENIEKPMMPNNTDTIESFNRKIAVLKQRVHNNVKVSYGLGVPAHLVGDISGGGQAPFSVNLNGQQLPVTVK